MRDSPIIAISILLILIKYSSACIRTANAPTPVITAPGGTVTTTATEDAMPVPGAIVTTTTSPGANMRIIITLVPTTMTTTTTTEDATPDPEAIVTTTTTVAPTTMMTTTTEDATPDPEAIVTTTTTVAPTTMMTTTTEDATPDPEAIVTTTTTVAPTTMMTTTTEDATPDPEAIVTTTTTVTPTTTMTTMTTTTETTTKVTTTQEMPNNPCQGCMAADINFLMANPNNPNSIDATSEAEANDPETGCARLMAVCAGPPGTVVFMTFNMKGGQEENQQFSQIIKAPLMCNAMGEWTYRGGVVTAVDCEAIADPEAVVTTTTTEAPMTTTETTTTTTTTTTTQKNACHVCAAADINFLEADPNKPDSIDATFEAQDNDPATGCARLIAVCAGPPGTVAYMTFNSEGGPEENQQFLQTIKAPLTCNAKGEWTYMGGVVTAVDCEAIADPEAVVTTTTTEAPMTSTETTTTTTMMTTAETTTQEMPNNLCQECRRADINFLMADPNKPDSIDATSEIDIPKSGCAELTAVCVGPDGTLASMQFNLVDGGPPEEPARPEIVKALLECNNMGKWVFMDRVITSVGCSAAPLSERK